MEPSVSIQVLIHLLQHRVLEGIHVRGISLPDSQWAQQQAQENQWFISVSDTDLLVSTHDTSPVDPVMSVEDISDPDRAVYRAHLLGYPSSLGIGTGNIRHTLGLHSATCSIPLMTFHDVYPNVKVHLLLLEKGYAALASLRAQFPPMTVEINLQQH